MDETRTIAARILSEREGPFTLEIYPTLSCNLACGFCDSSRRGAPSSLELGLERWLEILDEAALLGVRRVFVLGGGEPLTARDRSPAILERIKLLGMEGILGTNGTLLDARLISRLFEWGWDELHLSLDAPTAELHDQLRGSPGAFHNVLRATCALAANRRRLGPQARLPRLVFHFVITRQNHRTLAEMVRLAAGLGVDRVDFDALVPFKPEHERYVLLPDQLEATPAIVHEALRVARELGIATNLEQLVAPSNLERGHHAPPAQAEALPVVGRAPCLRPWHYLVVQQDGRTSPCCVLAGTGDSIKTGSLRDLWRDGPSLQALRGSLREGRPLPRCRECSGNILSHETRIRQELASLTGETPSVHP